MFELEVLVLELRAVDAERAGTVVPLEVSSLDHELWDANGVSGVGFEHFDTATISQPDGSSIRQLDNVESTTRGGSRNRRLCTGSGSESRSGVCVYRVIKSKVGLTLCNAMISARNTRRRGAHGVPVKRRLLVSLGYRVNPEPIRHRQHGIPLITIPIDATHRCSPVHSCLKFSAVLRLSVGPTAPGRRGRASSPRRI